VEIRRARPGEALALAEVHVRSWKAAFPGLLPQDYLDALCPEDRLGQWEEAVGAPGPWPVVLVADDGGKLLGFAAVGPTRDDDADGSRVGELYMLYVDPEAFGGGVGAALHDSAVEELTDAGFAQATLWVLHSNVRARRFYETHGWAADGTTKEHDWEAFTATDVRYRRPVSP
jgi:ribosomal protein S18 acetylase RimI-like enzyme